jgi:hypothetical protein
MRRPASHGTIAAPVTPITSLSANTRGLKAEQEVRPRSRAACAQGDHTFAGTHHVPRRKWRAMSATSGPT